MKYRKHTETRQIKDLSVRAMFVPSTLNEDERTVEVTFGTETPYLRYGWDGPYNEVLSFDPAHVRMDRLNSGAAPLLDNHDRWGGVKTVLGVVVKAWIENGEGRAIVRFSKREEVESVFQDVKDGILKGISVGYRVYEYQEDKKELKPTPNGAPKSEETPTYRCTDWEPLEISIAPVPADYNSVVRSADDTTDHQVTIIRNIQTEDTMKRDQIIAMLQKRGITVDQNATDEDLLATLERAMESASPAPAPAPSPAPAGGDGNGEEVRAQATAAERKRQAEIRTLCRSANMDEVTTEKYITEGTSVEAVRSAVLEKFIASDPNKGANGNPTVTGADREVEARRNFAVEALVQRSGQVAGFKATDAREVGKLQGMTLLDLAKSALEAIGVDHRGMNKMDIVARAFTSSGSDLPVILEGTNRRILLANYEATADTWRRFCATGSVSDFREYKRLRMGSFNNLDQVNENGEFKNKRINDAEYEKISIKTKGNLINLSRQMIIDDDLGAFARLASMLGRAAARSIESDVYALLALNSGLGPNMVDGNPLFHSSHGNIGTGSALTVAGLDADRVTMASQKDQDDNDFLDIRPEILLLPLSLESTAKVLNSSTYDPDATNKLQKPNVVAGMFGDIVGTPRLSGTRRYMFANPNIEPVLEVAFLDGVQAPFMDTKEGFNVDGTSWKIRLDYGVGAIGYKGALTNAGA